MCILAMKDSMISCLCNDYERYISGELNSLAELLKVGKVQVKHIFSSLDKEHTQCTLCLFIS